MKNILLSFLTFPLFVVSQTGITVPEMTHCDTQVQSILSTFDIPAASFSLAKNGKLVFSRAYGNTSISGNETAQPYHMFRVASVSKPITAIGIMKMVDDGLLSLSDKVFGEGGLLENHWVFKDSNISDSRVYDITVQMLLEHTAGWDRNVNCFPNPTPPYPWFFGGCDPIVVPLHITELYGTGNPVKEEHLIQFVLEKQLNNTPGTTYAYSNMGFLILSEIIEEISGISYEAWMQQEILHPLGIYDMFIAKNLLEDKRERETEYQGNGFSTLDLSGSGNLVPWEYGGMAVDAMDGHGGWIATARDLTRLLVAVDGFPTKPDILSSQAITTMSTPSTAANFYAKGWSVNSANNWWHTGAIDGTASIFVRTSGEYTWAILLNKRIIDANASAFWAALDGLGWNCLSQTSTFPSHDLFDAPTVNAKDIEINSFSSNTIDFSWTNGNGSSRIVVAREVDDSFTEGVQVSFPLDGTDYSADNVFGSGDNLGANNYVVYNGSSNSFQLSGLNPQSQYALRVYEYNKTSTNGNNALYLLGDYEELITSTQILSLEDNVLDDQIHVAPVPFKDVITINTSGTDYLSDIQLIDVNGRVIGEFETKGTGQELKLDLGAYASGFYILKISSGAKSVVKRIIKE
ncbi:MAG: serine hydrolase [Bacteroidota bacterium]